MVSFVVVANNIRLCSKWQTQDHLNAYIGLKIQSVETKALKYFEGMLDT